MRLNLLSRGKEAPGAAVLLDCKISKRVLVRSLRFIKIELSQF